MERYNCYNMPSRCLSILTVFLATLCLFRPNLANPTSTVEVNTEDATTSAPSVNILSVERSPMPGNDDESKFSIRFTKHADVDSSDVFARVYDQRPLPRAVDSLVEEPDGEWLTEFTVNRGAVDGRSPWVYIGITDDYSIALELNNFWALEESQGVVNVPELRTQPAMEAVYEPGQDVQVTVSSPTLRENTRFYSSFSGVDLLTNQYHYNFEHVDLFDKSDLETLSYGFQQTITVTTSIHPVSGFMKVITFGGYTGGSVVIGTLVTKYILVRPNNQASYLPPGYLAVVHNPHYLRRRDPIDRFTCRSISTCKPTCNAVGDSISDLQAFQVLPDGGLRQMTALYPPQTRDTYRVIYWHLNNQDGSIQEDQTIRFNCVAYDAVNNRTATGPVNVYIATGALLD